MLTVKLDNGETVINVHNSPDVLNQYATTMDEIKSAQGNDKIHMMMVDKAEQAKYLISCGEHGWEAHSYTFENDNGNNPDNIA